MSCKGITTHRANTEIIIRCTVAAALGGKEGKSPPIPTTKQQFKPWSIAVKNEKMYNLFAGNSQIPQILLNHQALDIWLHVMNLPIFALHANI